MNQYMTSTTKTADFLSGNTLFPKRISLGHVQNHSWHPIKAYRHYDFLQTARLESSCFFVCRLPFASGPSSLELPPIDCLTFFGYLDLIESGILTHWFHTLPSALIKFRRCVQDPRTYSPQHSDLRLLPIPTSWGRVADPNLN